MAYRFGTSRQERHTRLNHFSMRGPHRARALRDRSIACSCLARVIAFSTLRICTSTSAGLIRANRPSERPKVMASVEPFAELHSMHAATRFSLGLGPPADLAIGGGPCR